VIRVDVAGEAWARQCGVFVEGCGRREYRGSLDESAPGYCGGWWSAISVGN